MVMDELQTVITNYYDKELHLKPSHKQLISKKKKERMCPEWKKARSRMAARSRREKESQLLREIAALLPLDPYVESQLDKASVIRVTIAYLHLRSLLDGPDSKTVPAKTELALSSQGELAESKEKWFLDYALRGFLLVISLSGKIIITTQDVISYIGINQTNLIGRSLFDFMHPCDHKEIKEILTRLLKTQGQQKCEVFLRIKGAVKNLLIPWKVYHCTGVKKSSSTPGSSYLLLLCRSLPVQEVIEVDAHQNVKTFLSIHGPDMKFTYCHSGVLELTGFTDIELYGQTVYQYCHPSDCQHILKAHHCLFSKGQVYIEKYRLLQKRGGYVWVETDASVVYNIRTGKPESIVCINYILSEVELPDVVFSLKQKEHLLNPCDSPQPHFQSIPAPVNTTTKNEISQAPTMDEHAWFAQDGEGRGCMNEQTAVCNSPAFDMIQDDSDLDSLAPYIPMHEEDFLLTPALDGLTDTSVLDMHRLQLNMPQLLQNTDEATLFKTAARSNLSLLQNTESCFSFTTPLSNKPATNMLRVWHDRTHELKRKEHVRYSTLINFHQKRRTHKVNISQHLTDILCKKSDERSACSWHQCSPGPVPLALKYAKFSWCPSKSPQHTSQSTKDEINSVSSGLPVLSRWDCEVNAPLGPTSHLLQGTELTNVLDQVTTGVSWC